MLNPEILKCHEDIITLETYVQQGKQCFSYVKTLTSLAIWGHSGGRGGGGGFNNQTQPILVHIYPLFNTVYLRVLVDLMYKSNSILS